LVVVVLVVRFVPITSVRSPFRSVVLKVGGIAPLGAILSEKGANKTKGAIGGRNNTKGAKTLSH